MLHVVRSPKRYWPWLVAAALFILINAALLKQRRDLRKSSSSDSHAVSTDPIVSSDPNVLSDRAQLLKSLLAEKSLTHLKHLLSTNGVSVDQIEQLKRVGTWVNYTHSLSASEIVTDVRQISLPGGQIVIVAVALAHLDFEQTVAGFAHPGVDCDRAFIFDEDGRLLKQVGTCVAQGPTMELITVLHLGTQHSWFIVRDTAAESAAAPFTIKTEVYRLVDDFPILLTFYHYNGDTMITHKPEHFGTDGPGFRFSRGPLDIEPGTLATGEDGRTYSLRLIWNPDTAAFEGAATPKVEGLGIYRVVVSQSPGFIPLDKRGFTPVDAGFDH